MKTINNNLVKVIMSFLIIIFIVSMGFAMSIPLSLGSLSAESEIGVVMENLEFAEDRVLVVLSNKETKSFRNYTKTASPIIFKDFNGMVGQCKGLKHYLL